MDFKLYSVIRLGVPDFPTLYLQVTTYEFKISKQTITSGSSRKCVGGQKSAGELTGRNHPILGFKSSPFDFFWLKTDNFRFKPEVRGRKKS